MRRTQDDAFASGTSVSPEVSTPSGAILRMDCCGMRCPQPVLRLAVETAETPAGTVVEIVGDCPTFARDIRVFCERRRKTLLATQTEGEKTMFRIQY